MKTLGLAMLVLLVTALVFPSPGSALMVEMSMDQLSQEADNVVRGTVVKQVSAWNLGHTAIHTDVTIAVDEVISGSERSEVTFRIAGGVVGEIGMRTSNDPVFQTGESVIVFVGGDEVAVPTLVGKAQGAFKVEDDAVIGVDGKKTPMADFVDAVRADGALGSDSLDAR